MRRDIDFDICEELLEAISKGNYPDTVCALVGIAPTDLKRWLAKGEANDPNEDPLYAEFYREYRRAEAGNEVKLVNVWQDKAETDWKAAKEFLERRHRDKWALSPPVTLVQNINNGVDMDSEARRVRIEELMNKKNTLDGITTMEINATEVNESTDEDVMGLLTSGTGGDYIDVNGAVAGFKDDKAFVGSDFVADILGKRSAEETIENKSASTQHQTIEVQSSPALDSVVTDKKIPTNFKELKTREYLKDNLDNSNLVQLPRKRIIRRVNEQA